MEAKSGIQDAAENFDSKSAIVGTKKQFGQAVMNSFEEVGKLIEQAGVYKAIDNIVHSLAGVPTKVYMLIYIWNN